MLILPIINYNREKDRNRIMEIQITLKDAKKIYSSVILVNTKESEVVINHKNFSESSYSHDKSDSSVVDFIRNTSLVSKNDFLMQFQANILRVLLREFNLESTCLGAVFMTGLATGAYKDLSEIKKLIIEKKRYIPGLSIMEIKPLISGWRKAVKKSLRK